MTTHWALSTGPVDSKLEVADLAIFCHWTPVSICLISFWSWVIQPNPHPYRRFLAAVLCRCPPCLRKVSLSFTLSNPLCRFFCLSPNSSLYFSRHLSLIECCCCCWLHLFPSISFDCLLVNGELNHTTRYRAWTKCVNYTFFSDSANIFLLW